MQRDVRALVDGTVGGGLGTIAMSIVMVAAQKVGALGDQPPARIVGTGLDALGLRRTRKEQAVLAVALHLVFGSTAGALFGLLSRRLPVPLGSTLQGVLFASLIWATSYQGWIPALGMLPPPARDRPGRPQVMVLAHWLYGAILGAVVGYRAE